MVYYIETNLIALLVAVLLIIHGWRHSSKHETSQMLFNAMSVLLALLCISDVVAYISRGQNYLGVEISNLLYFACMAIGSYIWLLYVCAKVGYVKALRKYSLIATIPLALLLLIIVSNPMHGLMFTVDENLLYQRGPLIALTWVVEWGYMGVAFGINIHRIRKESSRYRKKEYSSYLVFAFPVVVAGISQMLFYGTTALQVGFMISELAVFLNVQHFQTVRDELTGVMNRLAYQKELNSIDPDDFICIVFCDVNGLKYANDHFDHSAGDRLLTKTSEMLQDHFQPDSIFRIGGDEFVVLLSEPSLSDFELRVNELYLQVHKEKVPVASIGRSFGSGSEVSTLIDEAEQQMHKDKLEFYRNFPEYVRK